MQEAIGFVLRGSRWHGRDALGELMARHGGTSRTFEKALWQRFGEENFDWPWFEEWLKRFAALGKHPESWDGFFVPSDEDEDEDTCTPLQAALAAMRKVDLLGLAKTHGIQVRQTDKVDAIRQTLAIHLPQSAAETIIRRMEAWREDKEKKAFLRHKAALLYSAILGVNHAMERARQLTDAGFRYYVFRSDDLNRCPIHERFDGLTLPSEHPFWRKVIWPAYPGDCCRILGASGPESAKLLGGKPTKRLPEDWESLLA